MGRARVQFVTGLMVAVFAGGSLAVGGLWLAGVDLPQSADMEAAPNPQSSLPTNSKPAAPPDTAREPLVAKSWMPPADGQRPDVLIHVDLVCLAFPRIQTEFPLVWAEYDPFSDDVPGGSGGSGDGRGPDGEGIGFTHGIHGRCIGEGRVSIHVYAAWRGVGGVSGRGQGKIVVQPQSMTDSEVREAAFGDGLVVRYWVAK